MKTEEELKALKEEAETLKKKHTELTREELDQVTGGESDIEFVVDKHDEFGEIHIYIDERENFRRKF